MYRLAQNSVEVSKVSAKTCCKCLRYLLNLQNKISKKGLPCSVPDNACAVNYNDMNCLKFELAR